MATRSLTARMCIMGFSAAAITVWSGLALAQWPQRKPKPAPAPATTPAPGGAAPAAEIIPFIIRDVTTRRDWTLRNQVTLLGYQYRAAVNQALVPTSTINLNSAAIVYPQILDTSFATARTDRFRGDIRTNSTVWDDEPVLLEGYQGPTRLAVWEVGEINSTNFRLEVEISQTSYEVEVDEDRAREVAWPTKEYAPEIALNLQPSLFVQSDHPDIIALTASWTGNNVKSAKPYDAAKFLAGKVLEYYQPTGQNYEFTGRGSETVVVNSILLSGFRVYGAVEAAHAQEGSEHDMACLLCAVYRAAGIPARLVLCYDQKMTSEVNGNLPFIRSLVEFYLWDEMAGFGQWVPVDIVRQRQFSSRPPRLDQTWEFFGRMRDSEFLVPFSHHYHPPEAVTNAGAASVWGWYPTNGNPVADTHLLFSIRAMSKDADDMKEQRDEQRRIRR